MHRSGASLVTIIAILLLTCLPLPSLGQATTTAPPGNAELRPRVAVTVVLEDTTAATPGFRIIRRVDQRPLDVIVLSGPADGETLSEAVRTLLMVRQVGGDTATRAGQVRVRRPDAGTRPLPRPYPWAARVVGDLRAAPPRDVAGIGTFRAVEIWFPPQRPRAPR